MYLRNGTVQYCLTKLGANLSEWLFVTCPGQLGVDVTSRPLDPKSLLDSTVYVQACSHLQHKSSAPVYTEVSGGDVGLYEVAQEFSLATAQVF